MDHLPALFRRRDGESQGQRFGGGPLVCLAPGLVHYGFTCDLGHCPLVLCHFSENKGLRKMKKARVRMSQSPVCVMILGVQGELPVSCWGQAATTET